jgi:pectinesterase
MQNLLLTVATLWCLSSSHAQQVLVDVANPASFDRPLETVEIPWKEVQAGLSLSAQDHVEVLENGKRLVSQEIHYDAGDLADAILVQSAFRAHEQKRFVVRRAASVNDVPLVTDAKYVLPRKDIAWENDRIAYRIYGGSLAGDVKSGIDVWVKRVHYRIIDKWYDGDSLRGSRRVSYHVDHGEGADYFQVGKSLGAGGSALWNNHIVHESEFFTTFKIVATGPIRAAFNVRYENGPSGGETFVEERTIMLDAGMNLNKIVVRYPGVKDTALAIALGLVKRDNTASTSNQGEGWLGLWGPADADSSHGSIGTGIVVSSTDISEIREDTLHHLVIASGSPVRGLTYYAGAGWTGSGDFASAHAWNEYLSQRARSLQYPLKVIFTANEGK